MGYAYVIHGLLTFDYTDAALMACWRSGSS